MLRLGLIIVVIFMIGFAVNSPPAAAFDTGQQPTILVQTFTGDFVPWQAGLPDLPEFPITVEKFHASIGTLTKVEATFDLRYNVPSEFECHGPSGCPDSCFHAHFTMILYEQCADDPDVPVWYASDGDDYYSPALDYLEADEFAFAATGHHYRSTTEQDALDAYTGSGYFEEYVLTEIPTIAGDGNCTGALSFFDEDLMGTWTYKVTYTYTPN